MHCDENYHIAGSLFACYDGLILILDKIVIKEQRCAIIVKGDNYGEEIRNQRRRGKKVSELTGYNEKYLYKLYRKYLSGGIEAITGNHYGGNRRNMSYEEEEIFLSQFINEADGGHITDVKAIKAAYDKKVGHETGHGQIYFVLHRHGWSKKLPRSRHPKSAKPEAIEASKKLTLESKN